MALLPVSRTTRLLLGMCLVVAPALAGCDEDLPPFGLPGGLTLLPEGQSEECPLPEGAAELPCPDWETEIFPLFASDLLAAKEVPVGGYGCSDAICHGADTANAPFLPVDDPALTYANLAAYERGGRPYISTDAADLPYMLCNFSTDPEAQYGRPMPYAPAPAVDGENLNLIAAWAACGYPGGAGAGGGGVGGGGGNAATTTTGAGGGGGGS